MTQPPHNAGMTLRLLRSVLLVPILLIAASSPRAQQAPAPADRYAVRDVMIPTRDGTKLFTRIYTPKDQAGPLPMIMHRTPYGNDGAIGRLNVYMRALADEGYIFVFQDIRGKFKSEGTFVMQRPARAPGDTTAIDEGTDTYDTIDWLLKNVPQNNGRVGMLGISYDGWTTIMGALEPHPALKAISPQASPSDMWLGDDFHHNGAFRLSYGLEYVARHLPYGPVGRERDPCLSTAAVLDHGLVRAQVKRCDNRAGAVGRGQRERLPAPRAQPQGGVL